MEIITNTSPFVEIFSPLLIVIRPNRFFKAAVFNPGMTVLGALILIAPRRQAFKSVLLVPAVERASVSAYHHFSLKGDVLKRTLPKWKSTS